MFPYQWRITKYNPIYRNDRGVYTKEEWTSISDIGNIYDEIQFNIEEYQQTENKYISTILKFMECLKLTSIQIKDVVKYDEKPIIRSFSELYSEEMIEFYQKTTNDKFIEKKELINLIKLRLREKIGFSLFLQGNMFVHFGYDYYMYIGSSEKCDYVVEEIRHMGLFVEPYESPYLDEE